MVEEYRRNHETRSSFRDVTLDSASTSLWSASIEDVGNLLDEQESISEVFQPQPDVTPVILESCETVFRTEILDAFDDLWTKYSCESSLVSTATDSNTSDGTEDNEVREEDRFSDDLKSDDMDERMRNGASKIGGVVTEWSETDTYSNSDLQTERQRREDKGAEWNRSLLPLQDTDGLYRNVSCEDSSGYTPQDLSPVNTIEKIIDWMCDADFQPRTSSSSSEADLTDDRHFIQTCSIRKRMPALHVSTRNNSEELSASESDRAVEDDEQSTSMSAVERSRSDDLYQQRTSDGTVVRQGRRFQTKMMSVDEHEIGRASCRERVCMLV